MIDKEIYANKKRWVMKILTQDIRRLVLAMLLGIGVAVLGLAVAIFSQKFIDDILPQHDLNEMYIFLCVTAGILVIKIATSLAQEYLGIQYNRNFNLSLIDQFFSRLLALPRTFFDDHDTGEIIARMNDTNAIHQTTTYVANTLVLNALTLISSSALLYYYAKPMAFMVWAALPVFFIIAIIFKKVTIQNFRMVMEAGALKDSNFISTIKNINLIKTHNKEAYFAERNREKYGYFQERSVRSGITGIQVGKIAEFFGTLIYMSMLSYAAYQLMIGNITIGVFSAALGVATGMLAPLGALGFAILQLQGARLAFDRMYEFVSLLPEYEKDEDDKKKSFEKITEITFDHVCFSYSPNKPLLQEVSFTARQHEILCFWGENGSGKSTMLKLLMRLYEPDSGNIYIQGEKIENVSVQKYRDKIGIVAQQSRMFDMTVIENICLDSDPEVLKATEAKLNTYGFGHVINQLADGYQTMVHENGENLSGGQKQIISLARALTKDPSVLILDEPSASLDDHNENFVISVIKEFKKYGMVIMVSHRHAPAKEADRIMLLKDGRIEEMGNHKELVIGDNSYAKSYATERD